MNLDGLSEGVISTAYGSISKMNKADSENEKKIQRQICIYSHRYMYPFLQSQQEEISEKILFSLCYER